MKCQGFNHRFMLNKKYALHYIAHRVYHSNTAIVIYSCSWVSWSVKL